MLKKAMTVACAAVALVAASVAAPSTAAAYDTTVCDQPSPPFEDHVSTGLVFLGYELITPVHRGFTGVTFCFEAAGTGQIVHASVHSTATKPNEVTYRLAVCGTPTQFSCIDVLSKTGVDAGQIVIDTTAPTIGAGLGFTCVWFDGSNVNDCNQTFIGVGVTPGDLPGTAFGPCVVVQPVCVPEPRVTHSQETGGPLLIVIVAGVPVAVDLAPACIAVPRIVCV